MKKILIALLVLSINYYANAQTTETIKVNAGNDIAAAVSDFGIYRFASFSDGTVFFKDGTQGKDPLNYNILNDQVVYINKKGDTLALSTPDQIKKITIGGINFYYNKNGYIEEIATSVNASLVIKRTISIRYEKEGGYGAPNVTGSNTSTNVSSGNLSNHYFASENAIIKKMTDYSLLNSEGRLLNAGKSNFISLFPQNKEKIESYLKSNKVSFSKEKDLVQLLGIAAAVN